jgi:hypothetical protein
MKALGEVVLSLCGVVANIEGLLTRSSITRDSDLYFTWIKRYNELKREYLEINLDLYPCYLPLKIIYKNKARHAILRLENIKEK